MDDIDTELTAILDSVQDLDRRTRAFYSKHGATDGQSFIAVSDASDVAEAEQLGADWAAYNARLDAFTSRYAP
jgi:hypothetical protein